MPLLIEEMRSSNALLRSLAIHMAANFGDTPLQEELARLLKEEKVWNVKLEVIKAVGQLRMLRTRPQLIEIIGNPKTLVEEKAAAMISLISLYETVEVQELQQLTAAIAPGCGSSPVKSSLTLSSKSICLSSSLCSMTRPAMCAFRRSTLLD